MKYIIVFVALLYATHVNAWVLKADFENGQVGAGEAEGESAFSDAFANTVYTNEKVHGGALAAVTSINAGDTGFGKWGGKIRFPAVLKEGDQIWFRVWLYYPVGFDFKTDAIGVKTLRIHTKSATGGNEGYFDMLTNGSSGVTIWSELQGNEFFGNNSKWKSLGPSVTTGQWHAFEQYVKLSSVPDQGIYRAWVDGQLVFEDTQTVTLRSKESLADFAYVWSYFNGGSPKAQKAFVDDIIVTNEVPSGVDDFGNRFVGVGDSKWISPPKPPTPGVSQAN